MYFLIILEYSCSNHKSQPQDYFSTDVSNICYFVIEDTFTKMKINNKIMKRMKIILSGFAQHYSFSNKIINSTLIIATLYCILPNLYNSCLSVNIIKTPINNKKYFRLKDTSFFRNPTSNKKYFRFKDTSAFRKGWDQGSIKLQESYEVKVYVQFHIQSYEIKYAKQYQN